MINIPWQICIHRSIPIVRELIEFRGYDIFEDNDLKDINKYLEFYKTPLKAPKQPSSSVALTSVEEDGESVANDALISSSKKGQGYYPTPIFRCRQRGQGNKYLTVYYHMYASSLSANDFKLYVDTFTTYLEQSSNQETVMIILQGSPEKQKRSLYSVPQNVYLQLFCIHSLMYNVMKHIDVPMHTIVSDEKVEEFVKRHHFTLRKDDFSKILTNDPIAMFIGLMPGDICRIDRPSASTGMEIVFRICI
jgi:DNA-directed RNA polymerase subunit H (RpoH/RPB5)